MEYHILFVDDNKVILKSLQNLFADEAYILHFAKDGPGALDLLADGLQPAVIVTDQEMPGMSGAEFLHEAKKIRPEAMRMMLTGYSDFKAAMDAVNHSGIFRLILKPWDNDDLKQAVDDAVHYYKVRLDNNALQDELQEKNETLTNFNEHLERLVAERTRDLEEVYIRVSNLTVELQQKVSELEGHDRINKQLLTIARLEDTLQTILEVVCEVVDGELSMVYGPQGEDNALGLLAVVGYGDFGDGLQSKDVVGDYDIDLNFTYGVYTTHKAVIVNSGHATHDLYSCAFIPVLKDGKCLAVLEVRKSGEADNLSEDNLKTIEQYLPHVAIAIADSMVEKDLPAWEAELDDVLQSYNS